jgi:hypothetical protein
VKARTEYPAKILLTRDGGLLDLLVDGANFDGESPFRVTCVPNHRDVYSRSASWRLEGEELFDRAAAEQAQAEEVKRADQVKRFVSSRP